MSVNSIFSGYVQNYAKPTHSKNAKHSEKAESFAQTAAAMATEKTQSTQPALSIEKNDQTQSLWNEKTQAYLTKLSEKFGNVNFVIGDPDDPALPKGSNGKQYNCYISLELLAQMAEDEAIAEKYEGVISNAIEKVDELKQKVVEKGLDKHVQSYGVKVNSDGSVDYIVMLKDSLKKSENSVDKKEADVKRHDKSHKYVPYPEVNKLTASSLEELLQRLEDLLAGKVDKKEKAEDPSIIEIIEEAETSAKSANPEKTARSNRHYSNNSDGFEFWERTPDSFNKGRTDYSYVNGKRDGWI